MVKDELDILRRMFMKFDYYKFTVGTPLEQLVCLNNNAKFIQSVTEQENLFIEHARN